MSNQQPLNQIPINSMIIMLSIVFCCSILSTFVSVGTIQLWGDASLAKEAMTDLKHLRLIQIIQSIGTFIVPSIIGVRIFFRNSYRDCFGREIPGSQIFFISMMLMVVSAPLINWASFVNQNISFPPSFEYIKQWATEKEEIANDLTRKFLIFNTTSDLLINIGIMAILPAIAEEWLFRGMIQPLTMRITKRAGSAIIITAILFSAMHFQFLTFLPRVILGTILGYLYYYGKSLWLPIAAHFVNNLVALLSYAYYVQQDNKSLSDPLAAVTEAPSLVWSLSSLFFIVVGIYTIKRLKTPSNHSSLE
ncbi:MAG: CPBP family intramembrane metalloprotease [Breznakibacter sp.]|nr:CPBP family intramembrane metalloprotease [Breznakibacter sp.]